MPGRPHSLRPLPESRWAQHGCRWGLVVLVVALSGCHGLRAVSLRRNPGPFGANTPCVLNEHSTAEEVVAHVNRNVEKIDSWRASGVKIRAYMNSIPIPLSGTIVAARDRHLRLEVTSALGKEVDLGSNDEHFWLWTKPRGDQPPAVYFANHSQMDVARRNLPLPFEPEWLLEALAVEPLSAENVTIEKQAGNAHIRLVSQHQLPDGQTIRKVVTVHPCHGYVMEHNIYDGRKQPIVRVVLQDYRLDASSGAVLPRHVKLDWPQAEMSLAMDLGHVEVNPPMIPPAVWAMVQVPGTPVVDLGDPRLGGPQYASQPGPAAPRDARVARGPSANQPTVYASTQDFGHPAYSSPAGQVMSGAPPFPPDDAAFQPPQIQWQSDPAADVFVPPTVEDEAPGRATVDLLPTVEPF